MEYSTCVNRAVAPTTKKMNETTISYSTSVNQLVAMASRLYRAFLDERFFTTKEALALTHNKNTCMNTLSQLVKSRQVVKVRRGLYEVVPLEHVGNEKPAADKSLLARKIIQVSLGDCSS